jgi:hypothetical protein
MVKLKYIAGGEIRHEIEIITARLDQGYRETIFYYSKISKENW